MARTAVLGFPRIGPDRELKFALEDFWQERISADDLTETGASVRLFNLEAAGRAGIDVIPVGDFSYYDHVLDTAELVGVIAERHGGAQASGLKDHFVAACGTPHAAPLALSRWFGTGYHYLVPELSDSQPFDLRPDSLSKWTEHLREAHGAGVATARPVLLGPFSLLALSTGPTKPLDLLPALTAVYQQILRALADAGAAEVQLDEPCLVLDHSTEALEAFSSAYADLLKDSPLGVSLATYFGGLDDAVLTRVKPLKLAELHVDLIEAPDRLDAVLANLPEGARLSAGVVDGCNVWATDADRALGLLDRITQAIGPERLTIAASCSLMHVPYSAAREQEIDPELRTWLAFGEEKLAELALLKQAIEASGGERDALLGGARARTAARRNSPMTSDDAVRRRTAALAPTDYERDTAIAERLAVQAERLALPELPTTTLGALPQTTEIRRARTEHGSGGLSDDDYVAAIHRQIDEMVALQEMLELDVLTHGEPERRDMVEYFSDHLTGFVLSQYGWIQTYGNRAAKPPILYGDVARPAAMVVEWWRYAQSITERPVKATVTGPVTILQRSFVRDDQPREETCLQIALAIQDEVVDLEAADAPIIQIDEAAIGEGLPLRHADRPGYARRAIDCLRLTVAPVRAETRVHMHVCRLDTQAFIDGISELGADAISTDDMTPLDALAELDYPGGVGLGMYDVQSRRIPGTADLEELLTQVEERIPRDRIWVNPNCGLKTRHWPETIRGLTNLIQAVKNRRAEVANVR